jgi:hypothetical protein
MKARLLIPALLLLACSNSPPPPINQADPCINGPPSNDEPSACPTPEPSYANDVVPVLEFSCLICHSPTLPDGGPNPGYQSPYDYSTYEKQVQNKGIFLTQILACKMPNIDAGATPLDEAQRLILMDWIVCGTPNN